MRYQDVVEAVDSLTETVSNVRAVLGLSLDDLADQSSVSLNTLTWLDWGKNPEWADARRLLLWLDEAKPRALAEMHRQRVAVARADGLADNFAVPNVMDQARWPD